MGATAALAAVVSEAAPTGLVAMNEIYVGGLTAVVAFFGGTGRRWTWFLPAGMGAVVAGDELSLGLAGAAIAVGFWSVWMDSRSPARGALVAGLGMAALMRSESPAFHGDTALLAALAIIPVIVSGYGMAGRDVRLYTRRAALILAGITGVILAGLAFALVSAFKDLEDGMNQIDVGVVAARDADDDVAAAGLSEAARSLSAASDTLSSWFVKPARGLPLVGPNLDVVEDLTADTGEVAHVSALAASSADVDQLRFARGRMDPQHISEMVGPMEAVYESVTETRESVAELRSPWLVDMVTSKMEELDSELRQNEPEIENALGAIRIASGLLGGEGQPRRYLVLFTTPSEARARTGFAGNYAELVINNGELDMPRSGGILELNQEAAGVVPPDERTLTPPQDPKAQQLVADYQARYGRFKIGAWRDMNLSPDLPTVAQIAAQLYPQSGGGAIDGVLTVDPVGLAALMNFTGEIQPREVEGLEFPLTPDTAAQYLLHDQYLSFDERDERKDFLEDVSELVFDRLTSQVEMPSPREVIEILDPVVDAGHIQFATFDPEEMAYFDQIGLSGRFSAPGNDLASVVTSNSAGSKIDYFLQRGLRYDVTWDPATGDVSGKMTVTLTNTASTNLPDVVIGNDLDLPNGLNRSFVSLYTTYGATAARLDGQPIELQPELELGHKVYSTYVDIPAGGTATLELDIAGQWTGDEYSIGVPSQPLVLPDGIDLNLTIAGEVPFEIDTRGAKVEDRTVKLQEPLTEPTELEVSLITEDDDD